MKNWPKFPLFFIIGLLAIIVTSCDQLQTETPLPPSATQDICDPNNIQVNLNPIHGTIRQFVDISDIAYSAPIEQLNPLIAKLQVLRDNFEVSEIPECLKKLHREGLAYMDSSLEMFMIFLNDPYSESVNLKLEIIDIRWENYLFELSSAYGIPLTPSPTPIIIMIEGVPEGSDSEAIPTVTFAPTETPGPTDTPVPTEIIPEVSITTDGVTVRGGPGADYAFLLNLAEGSIVQALGRNEEGNWIKVLIAYENIDTGWVFASQVTLNVPVDDLEITSIP